MDDPRQPLIIELAERSYPIHCHPGALATAGALIADTLGADTRCLVVADATVAELHGAALGAALSGAGLSWTMATFPAGEGSKTMASAESLWQAAAAMRLDRQGVVIALGGGVCGDLAGFTAACWMRGVRLVQIPTTLLSMVDSSVGGKTGVNSAAGKNLIGAFHQPSLVIIDPQVVATMEPREYRAGLAEVIKYGIIYDPDFLAWQEAHATALVQGDEDAILYAVRRSCAIKAWFVANDEREQGVRAYLNYGHTFGHALEGETAYARYLHGEAVAVGMRMAAVAAQRLGMLVDDTLIPRQDALIQAFSLPMEHYPADAQEIDRLCERCRIDKKVAAGRTRFVLPRAVGQMEVITDPDPAAIRAGFASALGERVVQG